ncbi:hypothetical protein NC796_19595 [Aliifodinibius sp. S!AR15-10]|nr:hypothetical protein [Aliifodinibius sp. S!AR15-10]
MFAGPNGSGKSDLIHRLQESDLPLGPIVNADELLVSLQHSGFIDLREYGLSGITSQPGLFTKKFGFAQGE